MRRIFLLLLVVLMGGGAHAAEPSVLLLGTGSGGQEMMLWDREILANSGARSLSSDSWVEPKEWGSHAIVIVVGKSPKTLDEESAQEVEKYLTDGGVLMVIGAALPSLIHPAGTPSATAFPDWAKTWIGGKHWSYPDRGLDSYGPQAKAWPWNEGFEFTEMAFGRHPYNLHGLSSAENVVGTDTGGILAVNRVGKGAFIFVGPLLSALQTGEKVEQAKGEGTTFNSQVYLDAMNRAVQTILKTPPGERP